MKQRSTSSSNKHILSRNAKLFTVRTTSDAFQTKEEKLFENKSFIEIILGLIKKTQNDVLTKKIFYNIKYNFSFANVKNLLKDLKKDLIQINVEEKKKVNLNEKLLEEKKNKMKDIIFNSNNQKNTIINSSDENDIYSNNEKFMFEFNEAEPKKELYQLKMLNFKLENEIKRVDHLSKRMIFEKDYNKIYHLTNEFKLETIYIKQNDNELVNHILHNKLINRRKIFIRKVNMKNNQDIYINCIKDKIYQFKKDLNDIYQYYNDQILSEEEKSYMETVVEKKKYDNNIDNDHSDENSLNNNMEINKEQMKDESDSLDKNISNKDSSNNDDTCPNSSEKYQTEVK